MLHQLVHIEKLELKKENGLIEPILIPVGIIPELKVLNH